MGALGWFGKRESQPFLYEDEQGGLYNDKRGAEEPTNIADEPCILCGGPVNLVNLRTYLNLKTEEYYCGCQITGEAREAQSSLNRFLFGAKRTERNHDGEAE